MSVDFFGPLPSRGRAFGQLSCLLVFQGFQSLRSSLVRIALFATYATVLRALQHSVDPTQTAKAELAKLRQTRPFQLETINIQEMGQERWKKKYVYWIPALHLEGKEIAKGRWDAQTVAPALDAWQRENEEK
ncbi:hypothetical protein H0H81_002532 [Sphagnurus paluster]|uniref:Glutaredoxin-like protein n=1 Tax=Sphagnurus paluster TaxID=117069 RepID=A0A9P7FX44_9AGAR|nr:hypothetical protein H0H81_002532 [Sphagnurus paluster]